MNLAQLPTREPDADLPDRVRRRARAVFVDEASRPPWQAPLRRGWAVASPAFVAATCLAYLAWAFGAAAGLYG